MKITAFNAKAPVVINKFGKILDKLVNGDTEGLDLKELEAALQEASEANSNVLSTLNSVSTSKLKLLRANAAAGSAYHVALKNAYSLQNLTSVMLNMLKNEFTVPEEASIDDILAAEDNGEEHIHTEENPGGEPAPEDTGTLGDEGDEGKNSDDGDGDDVSVDDILDALEDEENCGGTKPNSDEGKPEDGTPETDDTEDDEGDEGSEDDLDLSNFNFDLFPASKPAVKKPAAAAQNSATSGIFPREFLVK